MSKLAYFNPQDGRVLQWIDTEAMDYNLPDASLLHACTDAEWELQHQGEMMVELGAVVPYVAPPPVMPPHAQLMAQTLARTREERQPIISVLDGLQASALAKGDGPTALVIEAVKQGLRDITKTDLSTCSTADEMRAAIMAAYAALVTANPAVATAFKGVLA